MLKMEPISITAESTSTYRVRFQTVSGEQSEFLFTVENRGEFDVVAADTAFREITSGDPAADKITASVGLLHLARHYDYAPKPKVTH